MKYFVTYDEMLQIKLPHRMNVNTSVIIIKSSTVNPVKTTYTLTVMNRIIETLLIFMYTAAPSSSMPEATLAVCSIKVLSSIGVFGIKDIFLLMHKKMSIVNSTLLHWQRWLLDGVLIYSKGSMIARFLTEDI